MKRFKKMGTVLTLPMRGMSSRCSKAEASYHRQATTSSWHGQRSQKIPKDSKGRLQYTMKRLDHLLRIDPSSYSKCQLGLQILETTDCLKALRDKCPAKSRLTLKIRSLASADQSTTTSSLQMLRSHWSSIKEVVAARISCSLLLAGSKALIQILSTATLNYLTSNLPDRADKGITAKTMVLI